MKPKQAAFPRSIVLTAEQLAPDLATAFARWQELGELPASAILCEFGGGLFSPVGEGAYRNVLTGEPVNTADLDTLSHVQIPRGKKLSPRFLMIFDKP